MSQGQASLLAFEREGGRVTAPDDLVALCRVEYPRLVRALTLYCGDPFVGEELAQEAIVKACARWSVVRRMDLPSAWLYRVGINLANSHFRRVAADRRARKRLELDAGRLGCEGDSADALAVRAAVSALPARQRTAIVLLYFLGLSTHEAAAVMECADGSVRRLAQKAVEGLKASGLLDRAEEVQRER